MSMPCDTGICNEARCSSPDCLPAGAVSPIEQEEKYYVSSPSFTLTDMNKRTNNTFINRYLERRILRTPKCL